MEKLYILHQFFLMSFRASRTCICETSGSMHLQWSCSHLHTNICKFLKENSIDLQNKATKLYCDIQNIAKSLSHSLMRILSKCLVAEMGQTGWRILIYVCILVSYWSQMGRSGTVKERDVTWGPYNALHYMDKRNGPHLCLFSIPLPQV